MRNVKANNATTHHPLSRIPPIGRFVSGLLLLLVMQVSLAQSHPPFGLPSLDLWREGVVYDVESDGGGGYFVGGNFTHISRQPRGSLAHVLADGSVNPAFAPTISGTVFSVVRLGDGSVIVGGTFSQVNGVSRPNLARLDASGNLVASWSPTTNASVVRLLLDGTSTLYVGGGFTMIGGIARQRLARLDVDTGVVDPSWAPAANGDVEAFALTSDDKLWVGGDFTTMNGTIANRAVRLNAAGQNDLILNVNGTVAQLQIDAADNVYLCGYFTIINGQNRARLVRVGPSGVSQTWGPAITGAENDNMSWLNDCELDNGALYLAGSFSAVGSAPRRNVARLLADGALDPGFAPATRGRHGERFLFSNEGENWVVSKTSSSHVVIGGALTYVDAQPRAGLAAVNASDGSLLPAVDAERPPLVSAVLPIADGWLVGGEFHRDGEVRRENLLKLEPSGALDPDWELNTNGAVAQIAGADTGPAAYIGGSFSRAGGATRLNLLKLDDAGSSSINPVWLPNPNRFIYAILSDGAGIVGADRLYIGGGFTTVAGLPRGRMARVSASGTGAPDSYNPNFNGQVNAIARPSSSFDILVGGGFTQAAGSTRNRLASFGTGATADLNPVNYNVNNLVWSLLPTGFGEMIVGGDFTSVGGQARTRLAKVGPSGLDPVWQPTANSRVSVLQSDGAGGLFVGGFFSQITGLPRSAIAKLSLDGTGVVDPNFQPNANGGVLALSVAADGLMAGGVFTEVGGQQRRGLARMALDGTPAPPDAIFASGFEPAAAPPVLGGNGREAAAGCTTGRASSQPSDESMGRIDGASCIFPD